MTAEQVAAGAAVVQTVLLGGALVYARRQVTAANDVREATERPFVVIELGWTVIPILELVVTNYGKSLAREVTFEFAPPLSSHVVDDIDTLELFTRGIPSLAPGASMRTIFDSMIDRKPEQHPDVIDVTLRYRGEGDRTYAEPIRLDLGILRRMEYVHRRDIHDVHDELKKVRETFERWTASNRLGKGVLIRTTDELRAEAEEHLVERERWQREQAKHAQEEGEQ